MRRRELIIGASATAAALAGCIGSAQEDEDPGSTREDSRTISVTGSGEVDAEPDLAVIQVAVESTGDSAAAVRDDLSSRIADVEDALLAYGIDEDRITTGRFAIRERIDHRAAEEAGVEDRSDEAFEEYLYYEGTHSLTVEVDDVEAAGEVIDTAVDAGADEVGRVEFTLSEEKRADLREEALSAAIESARSEAEFVADEIGASIVEERSVDTSSSSVHPVRADAAMYEAADDAAARTELRPDDVTVSATVDVTYEIA